jgi:hypothetical protein
MSKQIVSNNGKNDKNRDHKDSQNGLNGLTLLELEVLFDLELLESDRLQEQADCLSRRSATSLFRAGRVMSAIRDLLKPQRKWTQWQKDHKVGVTTAWQAIELFDRAGSEDALAGLTRTEALKKFEITTPRPEPEAKDSCTKKCDKRATPEKGLKVFTGESREEGNPTTTKVPVDQPQETIEPVAPATEAEAPDAAPAAKPETPAQAITPLTAAETSTGSTSSWRSWSGI